MKKIYKRILACALGLTFAFGAAACGDDKVTAYEIAVQNGFVGTEQEWLASLQGINGQDGKDMDITDVYEKAKENGFEGTLLEFMEQYFNVELREDNDTKMIASNICSTVSIYSAFRTTRTVTSNTGLIPTAKQETIVSASAGSGVIIQLDKQTGDALIVTNYHVIYDPDSDTPTGISDCIYLYPYGAFNGFTAGADATKGNILGDVNGDGVADAKDQGDHDGDGIKATFVGGAMAYDVALLRVSGSEYLKTSLAQSANIGSSASVSVGEKVFAVGNPNAQGISVTGGLISVESEYITMSAMDNSNNTMEFRVMRTDAAINSGNSGGGLYDVSGRLIGITNAKNVEEKTDNICYALPIDQVMGLVENLLANGGVFHRAMLGIMTRTYGSSAEVNENGKLIYTEKSRVETINNGAAAAGKLQINDEIKAVTVRGVTTNISRMYMIGEALFGVRKGDVVTLKVLRGGQEIDVQIAFDKDEYFTIYN